MKVSRNHWVFPALVALDETVDTCHDAPVKPTLGQRFAVRFLYAVSNGDRHAYDPFW